MASIFSIRSSALPSGASVVGFHGSEALGRPYVFEIALMLRGEDARDFDLGDAVGAKAVLTMDRSDGRPPFQYAGVLFSVELLHESEGGSLVRVTLVPQLFLLKQTKHSRLFTNKSVIDVIKIVLEEGGISGEELSLRLSQAYAPEEHICQYKESDFDFLSRWMEREGIYYFFEHGDSGEVLVLTDDKSIHEPLVDRPVHFRAQALGQHDVSAGAALRLFTSRHTSLPARVRLRDYDYARPKLDVTGMARVSRAGLGEVSEYGERFFTPEKGKKLAQVRAEELCAKEVVYQGKGTTFHLGSGHTFELEEHPRPAFNAGYLVTQAEHFGNGAGAGSDLAKAAGVDFAEVYTVEIAAIPKETPFRPERETPWPRIYGFENATIDGAADSEYAQIDDQGRYAVKIKFDESDLQGGKASTWIRMLQPHGGGIEGFHFPLRKGTEVVLTFLGGDPDRPVIAGVVPNALTPSPVTSGNHTKNVIQTGGRNRVEMEDQAGIQRITVTTPTENTMLRMGAPNDDHNFILKTDGNGLIQTGRRLDVEVGDTMNTHVVSDVNERYDANHKTRVKADHTTQVRGNQRTRVTGNHSRRVNGNQRYGIKGNQDTNVKGNRTVFVKGDQGHEVKGNDTRKITGNQELSVHGDRKVTVDGSRNDTVVGDVTVNISQSYTTNVTSNVTQNFVSNYTTNVTANYTTNIAGDESWIGWANGFKVRGGYDIEIFGGLKAEAVFGAKLESVVGIHFEARAAAHIEALLGFKINIGSAPEINLKPAKMETIQARINMAAAVTLICGALWLGTQGFEIHT